MTGYSVQLFKLNLTVKHSRCFFTIKKHTSLFVNQIFNRKFANSFLRENSLTACREQATNINKCGHIKLQNDFSKQSYC